jgi:hypothetical protein
MKSPLRLKNKKNTNLPKVERTKLQEIGLGIYLMKRKTKKTIGEKQGKLINKLQCKVN